MQNHNQKESIYQNGCDHSYSIPKKQLDTFRFQDSFSCIATIFNQAKKKDYIGVTSWDGKIAVFAVNFFMERLQTIFYGKTKRPLNYCCFNKNGSKFYYANISGCAFCYDLLLEKQSIILNPNCQQISSQGILFVYPPISFMSITNNEQFFLYTQMNGALQSLLKIKSIANNQFHLEIKTRFQIYKATFSDPYFVGAVHSKHYKVNCNQIMVVNIESKDKSSNFIIPTQQEIKGGFPFQSIAISTCKSRIALGKLDGFCYVFDLIANSSNDRFSKENQYSWKAHHKEKNENGTLIDMHYAINSIDFHSTNKNVLATGGSEGKIKIWKAQTQNRYEILYTFHHQNIPVISLKFLQLGLYIAYTIGNDWHQGPNQRFRGLSQLRLLNLQKFIKQLNQAQENQSNSQGQ